MKKAGHWFVIAFLAVIGVLGFSNGMQEMGDAQNAFQMSVQIADVAWGIFGLLTAIGLWRRRPWTFTMSLSWAIACVYAGTMASWAYAPPADRTVIGTVSAAVTMTVVAALVCWYARRATRAQVPVTIGPDS